MKKILINCARLMAVITVTGCAGYQASGGVPTVPMKIDMNNDSTWTSGFSGTAAVYDDDKCKMSNPRNSLLGNKAYMKPGDTLAAVQIPVGVPFTFAVDNMESRLARIAGCTFTATFVPQAGRQYRALYNSRGNAAACDIIITDQENQVVPSTVPEYSCAYTMAGIVKNGTRWEKSMVDDVTTRPVPK